MTIELEILVLGGAVIGLLCGIVGYWWATINLRKAAGGKSVAELTAEKEQYETDVVEHFKASADLLNEMTDKYRDVYRHMAEGAQRLVPGENVAPALAALQSGMLAAPGEPTRDAVIESETDAELPASDAGIASSLSADSDITEQNSADDGSTITPEVDGKVSLDDVSAENIEDSPENVEPIAAATPELSEKQESGFFSSKPVEQDDEQGKEETTAK